MTLLLTAMDIIEFQTSEKLYIFVMLLYTLIWKHNYVWFFSFVSIHMNVVYILYIYIEQILVDLLYLLEEVTQRCSASLPYLYCNSFLYMFNFCVVLK